MIVLEDYYQNLFAGLALTPQFIFLLIIAIFISMIRLADFDNTKYLTRGITMIVLLIVNVLIYYKSISSLSSVFVIWFIVSLIYIAHDLFFKAQFEKPPLSLDLVISDKPEDISEKQECEIGEEIAVTSDEGFENPVKTQTEKVTKNAEEVAQELKEINISIGEKIDKPPLVFTPIFCIAEGVFVMLLFSPILYSSMAYSDKAYKGGAFEMFYLFGVILLIMAVITLFLAVIQKSVIDYKTVKFKSFEAVGIYKLMKCPREMAEMMLSAGFILSATAYLVGFEQWLVVILGFVIQINVQISVGDKFCAMQRKRYLNNASYFAYDHDTPQFLPLGGRSTSEVVIKPKEPKGNKKESAKPENGSHKEKKEKKKK